MRAETSTISIVARAKGIPFREQRRKRRSLHSQANKLQFQIDIEKITFL